MGKEAETIGDLVNRFLRSEGLETPLNEHRLVSLWPEVVGDIVSRNTGDIYIRNGVLYVQIKSAPLRYTLVYKRKILVDLLNKKVGATVIHDIMFR